jgi:hypothetical protein
MGTLMFECPSTGHEVSTGLYVHPSNFKSLSHKTTYLRCPYCPAPHLMAYVRVWLADVWGPPYIPANQRAPGQSSRQ